MPVAGYYSPSRLESVSVPQAQPTIAEVLRFEDLPLGSRGSRRAVVRWSGAPTDTTGAARTACADTPRRALGPLAACQRCHQRCAVAGATLREAAAGLSVDPCSINLTSSRAALQSELAPTVLHVRPPSVVQSW